MKRKSSTRSPVNMPPAGDAARGTGTQKFHRGDVVHVAKNLGEEMSHFKNDFDGVVIGSYVDQYGGEGRGYPAYTVMTLDTGNEISWYCEDQLSFLRHGGEALIQEIKGRREAMEAEQAKLEWIIANWPKVSTVSLQTLGTAIGFGDLWGDHGEGIALYENSMRIMHLFDAAMKSGSLEQVKARIGELKGTTIPRRLGLFS